MQQIYFDCGSTVFPKAPGVGDAVAHFLNTCAYNINRGGYSGAYNVAGTILETREMIAELFHFPKSENVVFTANITYALNFILKGYLHSGDHVIISSLEHNAVMRPLTQLVGCGVTYSIAYADSQGVLDAMSIIPLIKENTKAVIMLSASNVCGSTTPVEAIGNICHKHGLTFILDTAQTAGLMDINMQTSFIDVLTFTGHKGLLGPQGIGGFILTDAMVSQITPIISGGTGSMSDSFEIPLTMPDRYEAGTINLPCIIGLHTALKYINEVGINNILKKELELTEYFIKKAKTLPNVKIIGKKDIKDRMAIVSIDFINHDNALIAFELDNSYGIMTRCGLHCSPLAHKTLNTFPQGTVRFAFGHQNTFDEIDTCIDALNKILK